MVSEGDADLAQLLADAGDGLYVTVRCGPPLGRNPVSGTFSVGASGRLIENGALGAPVRELTIASDLVTMLRGVARVGAPSRWVPLAGSVKTPPLLIEDMAISGV